MARVRVVIYREQSDEVLQDFVCEDPDSSGAKTAMIVCGHIPDDLYLGHTDELIAQGESV